MAVIATTSLELLQPTQLVNGVVFDRGAGGRQGFVNDIWVPAEAQFNSGGIRKGSFLLADPNDSYNHGMEGSRIGLADGAPRPAIGLPTNSEVEWGTIRIGSRYQLPWGRYHNYYKQRGSWQNSALEELSRKGAITQEMRAARAIALSMTRQRELHLAQTICGTDFAGTGAAFPTFDVTGMAAADFAGGGTLWSDAKFPIVEFIDDCVDYLEDTTGLTGGWHVLIGEQTSRHLRKNEQLMGLKNITAGTAAAGYGLQTLVMDPRLGREAVAVRISNGDRVTRVVTAKSRANFGTKAAPSVRFIWPDFIHFCYFGAPNPTMEINDLGVATGNIEVEASALLEISSQREELFRYEDNEKLFAGWAADEWFGFAPIMTTHAMTIFNA